MPPFVDKCPLSILGSGLMPLFSIFRSGQMPPFCGLMPLSCIKPQKNMVASDAITPIRRSRNRTIPIRHCFTDLFLISCPTFLLIFTITAVFDTSVGRRRWQPFFHIIPSLADSRPIVLSFINNLPAVLYNMFSITIGSA